MRAPLLICGALVTGLPLSAQPNADPNTDLVMADITSLQSLGRFGDFPTGRSGLSFLTRVCNVGTSGIPWVAAMNPQHPFFAFMMCREHNGRFEQISDRSYVKHGNGPGNNSLCATCNTVITTLFGPNCSDTYTAGINGNRFSLGPPDEIDPWLGAWNPVGSHFDRGEPNVGPPFNTDGQRSLTQEQVNALDPVTHRIEVDDADLNVAGARYFYAGFTVIIGEPDLLRDDSMMVRETQPQWWNGTKWIFTDVGSGILGSPLVAWTGASVDSAANGNDDGRLYVAVRVTGPDSRGMWHYEYAAHNRDNVRGIASFRVPICTSARVLNATFRDVDANPSNDWTVSVSSSEVAFLAGASNALEWNTIFNFAFDSDAAPTAGQVTMDQALPGPGAAAVSVGSQFPGVVFNEYLGDGCGNPAPTLSPAGSPPLAQIPNPTFGIQIDGLQPGGAAAFWLAAAEATLPFPGGCVVRVGGPVVLSTPPLIADPTGHVLLPLAIPNVPALEGAELFCQGVEAFGGGPLLGQAQLTNGLKVRIGNSLTCP